MRATSPAEPVSPAPDGAAAEPLELGSLAMAEALLGPAPSTTPTPTQAPAPAPAPEPAQAPEPAPAPAPDLAPDPTPASRAELGTPDPVPVPPATPPAPSWAGDDVEPTSTWAPEAEAGTTEATPDVEVDDGGGWTLPNLMATSPVVSAPPAGTPSDPPDADDGWSLPSLSAAPSVAPDGVSLPDAWAPEAGDRLMGAGGAPGEADPVPVGPPDAPGWASELRESDRTTGLPPLLPTWPVPDAPTTAPEAGRHRDNLPFLGIRPAPAEPAPAPTKASRARKAEQARTDSLVDPTTSGAVATAGVGAAAGAAAAAPGFLDLRPQGAGPPPTAATAATKEDKAKRRHRIQALVAIVAALLLVGGLVAYQLSTDGDGSTDAVLTADAASIEASDEEESRGISLGVGEDESAEDQVAVEEGKAEAADAAPTDDGVVAAEDDTTGSGSEAGNPAPATPGRLAVSASTLDFGGGTGEVVSIRNEGGSSVSWSASTSGSGFSMASASSGSLAAGQAVNLSVAFSANGVTEGTAQGTLTVSGGGSRSVALRASVNRPPTISGITWVSCGATSRLRANVSDESGVSRVEVAGTSPAGPGFRKTAVSQGAGSYRADIGPFSSNGQITYFVEATDSRGNVARSAVQYRSWNNGC